MKKAEFLKRLQDEFPEVRDIRGMRFSKPSYAGNESLTIWTKHGTVGVSASTAYNEESLARCRAQLRTVYREGRTIAAEGGKA